MDSEVIIKYIYSIPFTEVQADGFVLWWELSCHARPLFVIYFIYIADIHFKTTHKLSFDLLLINLKKYIYILVQFTTFHLTILSLCP